MKTKSNSIFTSATLRRGLSLTAMTLVFGGSSAFGQWLGTTDANWGTTTNWVSGAVPANNTSALFNGDGNGNTIINFGGSNRVANRLLFLNTATTNAAAYTFTNAPQLTITIPSANGESIGIREGVTTSQDLSGIANLRPSGGASGSTFNVINNGSGTLTLPTWIGVASRTHTLDFAGSGLIEVKGAGIQSRQNNSVISVTKNGSGTLVIHGGGTVDPGGSTQGRYNSTTIINAGVLRIRHDFALGTTASGTTVADGAALELQETTASADLSVGESLTLNGDGISNGGALRNKSGNNTLTGTVTLASDTRIHSDADTLTIDNAISGDFNLTLGGAGTVTLAGASTYTGTTTVSAGTLALALTGSIANSATISVSTGATLDVSAVSGWTVGSSQTVGGTGTIVGNTTIEGTLSPGQSPGTLAFDNNLSIATAATYFFEGGDLTTVGGTLDLNNDWILALGTGLQDGGSIALFAYDTAGTFDLTPVFDLTSLGFMPGSSLTLTNTGSEIVLNGVSLIPEPSAALLGGLGLLALLRRRREFLPGRKG